ncbi:hypothetical protein ACET3Z_023768 [Daucus carota]
MQDESSASSSLVVGETVKSLKKQKAYEELTLLCALFSNSNVHIICKEFEECNGIKEFFTTIDSTCATPSIAIAETITVTSIIILIVIWCDVTSCFQHEKFEGPTHESRLHMTADSSHILSSDHLTTKKHVELLLGTRHLVQLDGAQSRAYQH